MGWVMGVVIVACRWAKNYGIERCKEGDWVNGLSVFD